MRQVNLAHAAGAEEFRHLIGSDAGYLRVAPCVRQQAGRLLSRRSGKIIRHNMVNQRFNFFPQLGIAAQIMRRILIDHARRHLGPQRGGGKTISLEDVAVLSEERASELIALDEALTTLAKVDERKSRLVELRYFGGLSIEETAAVLGVSDETVRREWLRAKAFLHRELNPD